MTSFNQPRLSNRQSCENEVLLELIRPWMSKSSILLRRRICKMVGGMAEFEPRVGTHSATGNARACRGAGATPSLDAVCARRPYSWAGWDEETVPPSNKETDQDRAKRDNPQ